jgi:TetR/AcrR family transcriptional repressor of mexJK operon
MPRPDAKHAASPRPAPGRPKDLGKGTAILEAARRLFTTQGFDGASMDQIAAAAGVSKLTVYSHYGDKETLFAEVVKSFCEQQLPASLFEARLDLPLRQRLLDVGRAFFGMISSPEAVAGHRILCSPRMADSPLPRLFWDAGPQRVQDAFAELLRRRIERGELAIDDVPRAAAQFFTLLKGEPHARLVFGCATLRGADAERHLAATVDLFLRAYAPR